MMRKTLFVLAALIVIGGAEAEGLGVSDFFAILSRQRELRDERRHDHRIPLSRKSESPSKGKAK